MWMTFILHVKQFLIYKGFWLFWLVGYIILCRQQFNCQKAGKRIMTNEKKKIISYTCAFNTKACVYIYIYMRFNYKSACIYICLHALLLQKRVYTYIFTCAFITKARVYIYIFTCAFLTIKRMYKYRYTCAFYKRM